MITAESFLFVYHAFPRLSVSCPAEMAYFLFSLCVTWQLLAELQLISSFLDSTSVPAFSPLIRSLFATSQVTQRLDVPVNVAPVSLVTRVFLCPRTSATAARLPVSSISTCSPFTPWMSPSAQFITSICKLSNFQPIHHVCCLLLDPADIFRHFFKLFIYLFKHTNTLSYFLWNTRQSNFGFPPSTMMKHAHRVTVDNRAETIKRLKKAMMEEKKRETKQVNLNIIVRSC